VRAGTQFQLRVSGYLLAPYLEVSVHSLTIPGCGLARQRNLSLYYIYELCVWFTLWCVCCCTNNIPVSHWVQHPSRHIRDVILQLATLCANNTLLICYAEYNNLLVAHAAWPFFRQLSTANRRLILYSQLTILEIWRLWIRRDSYARRESIYFDGADLIRLFFRGRRRRHQPTCHSPQIFCSRLIIAGRNTSSTDA
jgi:hypothetical protein